ncbi:Uncharacterised protein (plasmid) [Legionella adelaidensis]|uniref:SH3 domain-containing protein n=1 Tax=Legionella adelaidensis TaxID=45056 RepID=A0A0W0R5J8_9GAMM|nr:hypothetical protein [Legionella adelaidensis]KTC66297.1 hypothetical protein Lade_0955 [Legionella adelaidensis]VEH84893.1 Uncharacterised protein [Legionella adelaidensis]
MKAKLLVPLLFTFFLGIPLTYADSSTEKQTTATFKTEDGKTIRCMVHPEDRENLSQVKSGEKVKLDSMGCESDGFCEAWN